MNVHFLRNRGMTIGLTGTVLLGFAVLEMSSVAESSRGVSVQYAGLSHTALGSATLSTARCNDCLIVSNIGSSGDDGVRVEVGEGQGFLASVDMGSAGALPPGAEFRYSEFTEIGGPTARLPHFSTFDSRFRFQAGAPGNAELGIDVSFFNPSQTQVRLYLQGSLVDSQVWPGIPPDPILTGALGTNAAGEHLTISNIGSSGKDGVRGTECLIWEISQGAEAMHLTGRPAPVQADRIEIDVTSSIGQPTLSRVETTAANIPGFSITDEALALWGMAVRDLGSGQMSTTGGDHLIVSNIGSSGDDGVEAEPWKPDDTIPIRFVDVDIAGVGGTSVISWKLEVRINRIDLARMRVEEGRLRAADIGGSIALSSFFDDTFSSFTGTVLARNGGTQVGSATGVFNGEVAVTDGVIQWPRFMGIEHEDIGRGIGEQLSKTHTYRFAAPVSILLGGSPLRAGPVMADEIIVVNSNSPGTAEINFVEVAGGGDAMTAPVLDISRIAMGPGVPVCPADITNSVGGPPDGTVNVFDLLELLSNWGTNGPGANIAVPANNVVDVFDLLDLLSAWGDC